MICDPLCLQFRDLWSMQHRPGPALPCYRDLWTYVHSNYPTKHSQFCPFGKVEFHNPILEVHFNEGLKLKALYWAVTCVCLKNWVIKRLSSITPQITCFETMKECTSLVGKADSWPLLSLRLARFKRYVVTVTYIRIVHWISLIIIRMQCRRNMSTDSMVTGHQLEF